MRGRFNHGNKFIGGMTHMDEKSLNYWTAEMLLSENREDALKNAIKAFPELNKEDLEKAVDAMFKASGD